MFGDCDVGDRFRKGMMVCDWERYCMIREGRARICILYRCDSDGVVPAEVIAAESL